MKSRNLIWIALSLLISFKGYAQIAPFEISLQPIAILGLGGIQSFAHGQANGKWLIAGGRLDGLHRRQPWASFDIAGHNNQLIVVDPVTQQKWSAPLSSLPTAIQEQLSATNMEFYQEGDYLYCIGGYGYSATAGDHTTFASLVAIDVPQVINAIISNTGFSSYFRQVSDPQFQVTGGHLKKIYDTYYLLGGQKFIGRYNPMNGPTFTQEYTNQIRKFKIVDDGISITINHLPAHNDAANLHRRDYNAEAQILPDGSEGITMFSGVFQPNADLPFLNSVTLDSNGYIVNNTFQQYYNHYHCPVLPLYSSHDSTMHTVFFGGIAQFYDSAGILVQDDNVPFVNTIARVTRDGNGTMAEYKLPVEMPALLGAGAEFIPNFNFPHFSNEIFKLDSISTDSVLIGYIFGGINSSQPNIFFINDGTQSNANDQIFKVYIKKPSITTLDQFNTSSSNGLNFIIYPNPSEGLLNLSFTLAKKEIPIVTIYDLKGKLVERIVFNDAIKGENNYSRKLNGLSKSGVFMIHFETEMVKYSQKLIIEK